MDQFDVASGRSRQLFQILTVDRHDFVAVGCEQHDAGIDDVSEPRGTEESPGRPTKWLIERADVDSTEPVQGKARRANGGPMWCPWPGSHSVAYEAETSGG